MKIFVKAKPNSKLPGIEEVNPEHFIIAVKEPPKENQANIAIQVALAKHFGVSPARVFILSGKASRNKIFEIK